MGQLIAGPDDSSANLEHGLSCNESSESSLHSPTLGASAFGSTDTYGRLRLVPLATRLRLAPHQLREIRKSTGKLISKETMLLKPALPSESRGELSGNPRLPGRGCVCCLTERGQAAFS